MTGTTVGIILIVVAIIITNLTLLIQLKRVSRLSKRIDLVETALIAKAMADMGIETLGDLKEFLEKEIEKED